VIQNKEDNKVSFNLSPSSLNTYFKSPLLFYLTHIGKVPDDTKVPVCYGLSGNIVHNCLEKYAKGELNRDETCLFLASQWDKLNLNYHLDIKNNPLKMEDYLLALIKGLNVIDSHKEHVCEEMIKFPFMENDSMKIGIKGIIDLQAKQKEDNSQVIIDYKTSNSVNQGNEFERQALFYNYLIHKKKNIIPEKTVFHYLKLGVPKVYSFTYQDIQAFEEELNIIANELLKFGTNISRYPVGEINDLFNSKREACLREVSRRKLFTDPQALVHMGHD